jgi:hypothetical protein
MMILLIEIPVPLPENHTNESLRSEADAYMSVIVSKEEGVFWERAVWID